MEAAPSIWLAFLAGLLSFVSPCCLPLYPSYISYISGVSFERGAERSVTRDVRRRALSHALFFVLGFSVIFVALGASASLIGVLFAQYHTLVSQIGGAIVILMGLVLLGVIRPGFLMREAKWHARYQPGGYLGAFVVGLSFSAGWTPCIGPILAAVLAIAATSRANGILLLFVYTAGFAIPFLLLAYTLGSVRWLQRYSGIVSRAGGGVMVVMGVLLLTGRLTLVIQWLIRLYGGYVGL
jgi:cytochrome c-type biogenesis protein